MTLIRLCPENTGPHTIIALSDIHSNATALKACIDYAISELSPTGFLFLGDFITDFAYPLETLDLVYEVMAQYPTVCVRGNREDYLLDAYQTEPFQNHHPKHPSSQTGSLVYTAQTLRPQDWAFIRQLPLSQNVQFGAAPPFTICHATLRNTRELVYPHGDTLDYIFDTMPYDLILHGHSHTRALIKRGHKCCLDVGVCGFGSRHLALSKQDRLAYFQAPLPDKLKTTASMVSLHWSPGDKHYTPQYHDVAYDPYPLFKDYKATRLYQLAPFWVEAALSELITGESYILTMVIEAERRANAANEKYRPIPERYFQESFDEIRDSGPLPQKYPDSLTPYIV